MADDGETDAVGNYHVLLIGCDQYPPGQRSLRGCVNDIDAVECLLLDAPGIGLPPDRIKVTRLAAPLEGASTSSRFAAETRPPTRENVEAALRALADPAVGSNDRVLVYYSGHGGQAQRRDREGWSECLLPSDERPLYDDVLNPLIAAIAGRTPDLTVVLDCCHAAGTTRAVYGEPPHGATRFAVVRAEPDAPAAGAVAGRAPAPPRRGWRLLQAGDPPYLVVAACQAEERAQEDVLDGQPDHGFLTHSLIKVLGAESADQRERLRWADIWPRLLAEVYRAAGATNRSPQHPWIIGRPERRVFGGAWTPQDAGFRLTWNDDGTLAVEAGTLVGVTPGAILGVYGRTPELFPSLGSEEDARARIGQVRVVRADRATCVAEPVEPPPDPLPPGARARMLQPGAAERLRVGLAAADPNPAATLAESPLLDLDEGEAMVPEVWVDRTDAGWEIRNDTNRSLARVGLAAGQNGSVAAVAAAHGRLRRGLEGYARYNLVLRLARRASDPKLDQTVLLTLHDCRDAMRLAGADPKRPDLPDLPRNADGLPEVPANAPYCVRLSNVFWDTLHVTVFNCSALGLVEFLGEVTVRGDDTETLWLGGTHRRPFKAVPDDPARDTIDRIVAIGTTRSGVDLRHLAVAKTIQEVIDAPVSRDRGSGVTQPESNLELWTSTMMPLKVHARQ